MSTTVLIGNKTTHNTIKYFYCFCHYLLQYFVKLISGASLNCINTSNNLLILILKLCCFLSCSIRKVPLYKQSIITLTNCSVNNYLWKISIKHFLPCCKCLILLNKKQHVLTVPISI